jgi:hypothetical protein
MTMKTHATFIDPKQRASDRAIEGAKYRKKRPLLQGRVSRQLYEEARKRAATVDFSLSKWLGYWLELTFAEHPPKAE